MGRLSIGSTRPVVLVVGALLLAGAACVPDPPPAPTRVDITTRLTWCGGVVPPPGEPWCHTSSTSAQVQVLDRRDVVAEGTTAADGHLLLDVPVGTFVLAVVDPPTYMQCDTPSFSSVAGTTVAVVQTCTVFAP